MDGTFIAFIVIAALGLVALSVTMWVKVGPEPAHDGGGGIRQSRQRVEWEEQRNFKSALRWITSGLWAVAVLMLIISSFTRVNTNTIGVMTSFGRAVDAEPNGLHVKKPWVKKVEFDASRITLRFDGAGKHDDDLDRNVYPRVPVRIQNNGTADVNVTVTWQMRATTSSDKAQVIELFKAYKTFRRVADNFIVPHVRTALQATYEDVNPLVKDANPSNATLATEALDRLRGSVKDQVNVLSFEINFTDYDDRTEEAIKNMQAQIAKTAEETQRKLTNEAAAAAAAALGDDKGKAPPSREVLINKCLDIAQTQGREPGYCFLQGGSPLIQAR